MDKIRSLWVVVLIVSLVTFTRIVFADVPADPSTNPADALSQLWAAVVAKRYGIAAVIGTMCFVAFVRFIAPRIHGAFGAWVNTTRVSAALAFLGAGLAAVATQLMKGGAFSPQLIVYGFGFGVAAIGGYNAFWDLLFPADKKPAAKMQIPTPPPSSRFPEPPTLPRFPPPPPKTAALLPFVFIAFAVSGCAPVCKSIDSATCAHKVLIGIDALDGAAARIGTQWLRSCANDAGKLKDAGKLAEADAAYTHCEMVGGTLKMVVKDVEDSAQTAYDAVDVTEKIGQKDYGNVLAPVKSGVKSLYAVFKDLGLQLPVIDAILNLLGVQ